MFWLIEWRVLKRLLALDRAVDAVAKGGDPAQRVPPLLIPDEIARLGRSVNAMLAENESQQDAREARDAAVMGSRLKSEFLANMSHEVRTPFSGILGMLELALEHELPPEQRERLETAYRSANGLLSLLNDVLDFSKFNAGALVLEEVEFDLRQLIEDTTVLFTPRAEQHGLILQGMAQPLQQRGPSFQADQRVAGADLKRLRQLRGRDALQTQRIGLQGVGWVAGEQARHEGVKTGHAQPF